MQKLLFFLMFMVAIGLSTGVYAIGFRKPINLVIFSLSWQLAGLVYLGGAIWLLLLAWEHRGN